VLLAVLLANIVVTIVKIFLGLVTGALAVVADGFHSLVDSSSNLIGLAAIRFAEKPADKSHPYGYSRYETMGTLAIGGMLIIAAYEVTGAIISRFSSGEVPEFTPLTFWLVVLTLPVNLTVYLLERQAGKKLNSDVLLADASHTRTDLFVTLSVVAAMLGVNLGWAWLDLLIAAIVVVMIVRAAFDILRRAATTLADHIVIDPVEIERIALSVQGVLVAHQIRSRGSSGAGFVDLHVKVHSGMSTEMAHAIASEVERRLREELPEVAEALVHIEPAKERPSLMERIRYDLRQIADGMSLSFHDLHVHAEDDGSFTVELHLEMPSGISLGEGHKLADEFEERVSAQASRPFRLIAHLEPIPDQVLYPDPDTSPELRQKIHELILSRTGKDKLREFQTYRLGQRVGVVAIVTAPESSSLAEAHNLSETIERELLNEFSEVHRVIVHVEPEEGYSEETITEGEQVV
jgi:cation diffusion facilitator family transporter